MLIRVKESCSKRWEALKKKKLVVKMVGVKEVGKEDEGFWSIPLKECEIVILDVGEKRKSIATKSSDLAEMLIGVFREFGESCYSEGYLKGMEEKCERVNQGAEFSNLCSGERTTSCRLKSGGRW